MRITDENSEILAKRAEEAGMTRTNYMRLLLRVPMEMLSEVGGPNPNVFVFDRTTALRMACPMRKLGHHYNKGFTVYTAWL